MGNADYKNAPLRNTVNDARSMDKTLREMGFSVDLVENATQKEMKKRNNEKIPGKSKNK